ncbi:MAG: Tripartite ATP-independent periplasmic transporter, DctQ component [Proteobacteria bacterium]|uniref:TRAP transporter small permease protein n=1 Tax=Dechloromonas aromatica (strain RCB) TaxID=159087 RepID=Q478I2_DECAR|nr:Tripartite ATP-independent periplasmic transporter, DctQ component [Pseudomonadota bacterium]
MSHGFEIEGAVKAPEIPETGILGGINRVMTGLHTAIMFLSSGALLGAALILCSSVFLRYFLKIPTDWQDEMSVFLLVGATFMCAGYVQSQRGHIGIEALGGLLPPLANRLRLLFCDLVSLLFCAFFSWKSILLFHEAWVDGQTTSSSWAPPLAIPYGFMTAGMILLSLQILLQLVAGIVRKEH